MVTLLSELPSNTRLKGSHTPPLSGWIMTPVVVAYSVIGTSTFDGYGQIRVFDIDSDNDISVRGVPVYLNTAADATFDELIHLNSLAMLDSDTIAIAYRGDNADGFIQLYDLLNGQLTASGSHLSMIWQTAL